MEIFVVLLIILVNLVVHKNLFFQIFVFIQFHPLVLKVNDCKSLESPNFTYFEVASFEVAIVLLYYYTAKNTSKYGL